MKQITIGDKPLMQISPDDLLELVVIQGACPCLDFWNCPVLIEYCDTLFSHTIFIRYNCTRKSDSHESDVFVFFFHTNRLEYHYHLDNEPNRSISDRLNLNSIKFLIEKGYDIPIY